jgi:hypothetical protein
MKKARQHLTEVEVTAWILIAVFVAVLLMFSYLFWKRFRREFQGALQSEEQLQVAVLSDPHATITSLATDFSSDRFRMEDRISQP